MSHQLHKISTWTTWLVDDTYGNSKNFRLGNIALLLFISKSCPELFWERVDFKKVTKFTRNHFYRSCSFSKGFVWVLQQFFYRIPLALLFLKFDNKATRATTRWAKSVCVRSFSGPCFPVFLMRENTDQKHSKYGCFLHMSLSDQRLLSFVALLLLTLSCIML